jgi:hypothetical protein
MPNEIRREPMSLGTDLGIFHFNLPSTFTTLVCKQKRKWGLVAMKLKFSKWSTMALPSEGQIS